MESTLYFLFEEFLCMCCVIILLGQGRRKKYAFSYEPFVLTEPEIFDVGPMGVAT
jgi:hypothetical protein